MSQVANPYKSSLETAFQKAMEFLETLDDGAVGVKRSYAELKALWNWDLNVQATPPTQVIHELNQAALPGLNLNQSGRFFAWVIGGSHPSAIAADWLTSTWDQNAGLYACTPSSSIVEEIAGHWLKQLLKLPPSASFAFVTGCQMAHFTCLGAARNYLFHLQGWDVEARGLNGAPPVRIICGDQKHSTVPRALRMLGFGTEMIIEVPSDVDGRILPEALEKEMKRQPEIPALVLMQAGDIHTGAFDAFETLIPIAHQFPSWVHIDGAFGLWAAASPAYSHLMAGADQADSWATDGHKWLNVPYDSGYAFTAHPDAHSRAFAVRAGYLPQESDMRDQMTWTPEFSRRARGYATFAAIRELGIEGVADLVNRLCRHAHTIVEGASSHPQVEVMAWPIINQGVIRFLSTTITADDALHDRFTLEVIEAINASGEAFFQPSVYKGKKCMRVSVSGWRTTDQDVARTVSAIHLAIKQVNEKGKS